MNIIVQLGEKMKKIIIYLVKLYESIFLIFPCVMTIFLIVKYMLGGWNEVIDGHDTAFYFIPKLDYSITSVLILMAYISVILFVIYIINKVYLITNDRYQVIVTGVIIIVLTTTVRILLIYLYSDVLIPYSDFDLAWKRAQGDLVGGNINYYSLFPAYLNFSYYETIVINIFGNNYINILYFNAVYCGITSFFLFLIGNKLFDNKIMSIATSVIYSFYISNVVYATTGTPDFLAIMFNTIGIYILLKQVSIKNIIQNFVLCILTGIMFGLGGAFKTFSIIIIIAFFICNIIRCLLKGKEKNIFRSILCILIIFFSYKITTDFIIGQTAKFYNIDIDTSSSTPHFLLIGLNTEAEGQIHIGSISRLYYQDYLSNGFDAESAKDYSYKILKEDWENNRERIIPNFLKKMIWAWQDDYTPLQFFLRHNVLSTKNNEDIIYNVLNNYGGELSEILYLIIILLASVCSLIKIKSREIDMKYLFLSLIIFGYFCMIIISEAQSRYKCLVMPYIILLACMGINYMISLIGQIQINRMNHNDLK